MLIAIKKYKFYIIKIKFYKFIIKLRKLSINPKKIKAVLKQQKPSNITELQLFLKFYNYYKRFIKHQLNKIKLFTKLIRKDKPQIQK